MMSVSSPASTSWVVSCDSRVAAVLDQLVAAGHAVLVQIQDGNAQGGAGGLARVEEKRGTP